MKFTKAYFNLRTLSKVVMPTDNDNDEDRHNSKNTRFWIQEIMKRGHSLKKVEVTFYTNILSHM